MLGVLGASLGPQNRVTTKIGEKEVNSALRALCDAFLLRFLRAAEVAMDRQLRRRGSTGKGLLGLNGLCSLSEHIPLCSC